MPNLIDIVEWEEGPTIHCCPNCKISFPYEGTIGVRENCHKCGCKIIEFICDPSEYFDTFNEFKNKE